MPLQCATTKLNDLFCILLVAAESIKFLSLKKFPVLNKTEQTVLVSISTHVTIISYQTGSLMLTLILDLNSICSL